MEPVSRLGGVCVGVEIFPIVELEDQRQIAGVVARAGFEEPERGGVCTKASVNGQLKVIAWIIRGWVWERSCARGRARRPDLRAK